MSFYETHELHRKEELRTRWYQGSYEEMKKAKGGNKPVIVHYIND